jgi:deazaflavin-dependent oxidoreductase (nitroreductase family)
MRQINRIPRLILRSPAHRAISKKLLLLTFTGRRSGKRFTIPLGYVQPDERTVLVGTESPWSRNLRVPGGAPVTVRLRGRDRVGTAEVIDDEAGMTDAYRTMLTLDPGYGRFIDVRLGSDGQPVPEDIARARARGLVVVRIRLD